MFKNFIGLNTRFKLTDCLQGKQFFYRPGHTLTATGSSGSPDFKIVGTWRWWSFQPHPPATFTYKEIFLVLIRGWVDPTATGSTISKKNFNDTTENRTYDLPVCTAVPKIIALPATDCLNFFVYITNNMHQVSKIWFFHETLHVLGIFCAHHQELSVVHMAICMFHAGYVAAA
jgi:hypothetical protein